MRYRLAVLTLVLLLAMLPMMNSLAAPAPYPSAVLAIGPSPDLKVTDEEYRKGQKEAQTCDVMALRVFHDPEIQKMPSITLRSDPLPWIAKNLRVVEEDGGRRLRFTFRAGKREEQVTILNAVLRVNIALRDDNIKDGEKWLGIFDINLIELEQRLKSASHPKDVAMFQEALHYSRTKSIPAFRAAISRVKQTAVIKWAR